MQLAGVSAFTIPLMLLRELASTSESEAKVEESSLFNANATTKGQEMGMVSYIDEELKFREAFRSDGGIGQSRTGQVRVTILCTRTAARGNADIVMARPSTSSAISSTRPKR